MTAKIENRLLWIALLFLFGCTSSENTPPAYIGFAHEIVESFAKEMERDFGLFLIGSGGSMPHKIEAIEVELATLRKASIAEARLLEIQGTERLVQLINAHGKIGPYLAETPFRAGRANVSICFKKAGEGDLAYVFQAKNKIFYCASSPAGLVDLLSEPYEDALKSTSN